MRDARGRTVLNIARGQYKREMAALIEMAGMAREHER